MKRKINILLVFLTFLNINLFAQTYGTIGFACDELNRQITENANASAAHKVFVVDLFNHAASSSCDYGPIAGLKSGNKNDEKEDLNQAIKDFNATYGVNAYVLYTPPKNKETNPVLAHYIFNCLKNGTSGNQIDFLVTIDLAFSLPDFTTEYAATILASDDFSDAQNYLSTAERKYDIATTGNRFFIAERIVTEDLPLVINDPGATQAYDDTYVKDVNFVDERDLVTVIGDDYDTYLTPAGFPFTIPAGAKAQFRSSFNYTTTGPMFGFKIDGEWFGALYTGKSYFEGYVSDQSGGFYFEPHSKNLHVPHPVKVYENSSLINKNYFRHITDPYTYEHSLDKYKGEGQIDYNLTLRDNVANETDVPDATDAQFNALVEQCKNDLNQRISQNQGADIKDFIIADENDFNERRVDFEIETLRDKLNILFEKTSSNIEFYIDFRKLDFKIPSGRYNEFTQAIMGKPDNMLSSHQAYIYLNVNIWNYIALICEPLQTSVKQRAGLGLKTNIADLQGVLDNTIMNDNLYETILNIYKQVPKKQIIYTSFLRLDGTVMHFKDSADNVTTNEKIIEHRFYYDSNIPDYLDDYNAFLDAKNEFDTYYPVYLEESKDNWYKDERFEELAAEMSNNKKQLINYWGYPYFEDWICTDICPEVTWIEATDKLSKHWGVPHILKESFTEEYKNEYVCLCINNVFKGMLHDNLVLTIPDNAFLPIDCGEAVYNLIDNLSLALIPTGFDALGDACGLAWAIYRGDKQQQVVYSGGLMAGVLTGALIREMMDAGKFLNKHADELNETVHAIIKKLGPDGAEFFDILIRKGVDPDNIKEFLEKLAIDQASAANKNNLLIKLTSITDDVFQKFTDDVLNSTTLGNAVMDNPGVFNKWKTLHELNPESFVKTDAIRLETFSKFSQENQILIAKYTDANASSSLSKFIDDCNDNFIDLIEDEPKYLDCFLSYKRDTKWSIEQFDEYAETIINSEIDEALKAKTLKWLDHSSAATKFGNVAQKGIDLSNNIFNSLGTRAGNLFENLAAKLKITPNILSQYEIYKEVSFFTEGGFMKADIVLVKRGNFGFDDVIVIENKLSLNTDYTVRQKEGWKKLANGEDLIVKTPATGKDANGNAVTLNSNDIFTANKVKPYKINDHGEPDITNVTITVIPVNNWKNYTYNPM